MPNMKQIADMAGVSLGTVSHVLNDSARVREPLRRRVLEAEEFGLIISARDYYNSVRKMVPDKDKPETIDGLLVAL